MSDPEGLRAGGTLSYDTMCCSIVCQRSRHMLQLSRYLFNYEGMGVHHFYNGTRGGTADREQPVSR